MSLPRAAPLAACAADNGHPRLRLTRPAAAPSAAPRCCAAGERTPTLCALAAPELESVVSFLRSELLLKSEYGARFLCLGMHMCPAKDSNVHCPDRL